MARRGARIALTSLLVLSFPAPIVAQETPASVARLTALAEKASAAVNDLQGKELRASQLSPGERLSLILLWKDGQMLHLLLMNAADIWRMYLTIQPGSGYLGDLAPLVEHRLLQTEIQLGSMKKNWDRTRARILSATSAKSASYVRYSQFMKILDEAIRELDLQTRFLKIGGTEQ